MGVACESGLWEWPVGVACGSALWECPVGVALRASLQAVHADSVSHCKNEGITSEPN